MLRALVPALLVVRVFVQLPPLAVEADGSPLRAHVDLELARSAAALPAVIAIAQPEPLLAQGKADAAARGKMDKEQPSQRSSQLGEGVYALRSEEHGDGNEAIDRGQVARLDADGEEEQKLHVAVEHADGDKNAEDAAEAAVEGRRGGRKPKRAADGVDGQCCE